MYIPAEEKGVDEMEKQMKTLMMPIDLIEQIEEFQKDNFMTSFTGALIELVRRSLKKHEEENTDE